MLPVGGSAKRLQSLGHRNARADDHVPLAVAAAVYLQCASYRWNPGWLGGPPEFLAELVEAAIT